MTDEKELVNEIVKIVKQNLDMLDSQLLSSAHQPNDTSHLEKICAEITSMLNTVRFYEFARLISLSETMESLLKEMIKEGSVLIIDYKSCFLSMIDSNRDIIGDILINGSEPKFLYGSLITESKALMSDLPNQQKRLA